MGSFEHMDSVTQFVLGAAVGEAVLGKKVGNRAMLWGGIAGTIPDLDVALGSFMSDINALAFHRGFSHSITFAILAAIPLGWLVHRFYSSGIHRSKGYKWTAYSIWLALFLWLAYVFIEPSIVRGAPNYTTIIFFIAFGSLIFIGLWKKYVNAPLEWVDIGWKPWAWLFFWSIFTHPLLDCFTTFGTQLFLPFSDYRVSFNVISVADPAYTVPFLICLIVASFIAKAKKWRAYANYLGIALSSAYMLFAVYNKVRINDRFEKSLSEQNIAYERYMTTPSILNNFLWTGIAISDSTIYHGDYSFFDSTPRFTNLHKLDKERSLIDEYQDEKDLKILDWFTNGYYQMIRTTDGILQVNDLRFGIIKSDFNPEKDFVFNFQLIESDGYLTVRQGERDRSIDKEEWKAYWARVGGKKE